MKIYQLAPAVELHLLPMDKFKTNEIFIDFIMPLNAHTASYATLMSMVLKSGCKAFPGVREIGKALDELYGAKLQVFSRKKGDAHIATFSMEFLDPAFVSDKNVLSRALALLNKIIFEPKMENGVFSQDIVEREKKNLCDIIDSRIDDKRMYALRRCGELTAAGQPYEVYENGDREVVEGITPQSLYQFYCDYLTRAIVKIFAFGRLSADNIISVFAPSFSSDRNPQTIETKPIVSDSVKEFEEIYPVEQAKLSMAFSFNAKYDELLHTLFVILFGGSANSLLFTNVREKLSLCYYCSAVAEKHKQMMTVYSGVMPKNVDKARNEIIEQLNIVKQGRFTENDLIAAKRTCRNNLRSMNDSMSSIEDYALSLSLRSLSYEPDILLGKIEQVKAEDIQQIAEKISLSSVYVLKGGESYE